jgi:membrane associated rhomboid family serine protease
MPGQKPAIVSDVPSRQAVTGHNVRYVLLFGISGAVIGLIGAMILFFH